MSRRRAPAVWTLWILLAGHVLGCDGADTTRLNQLAPNTIKRCMGVFGAIRDGSDLVEAGRKLGVVPAGAAGGARCGTEDPWWATMPIGVLSISGTNGDMLTRHRPQVRRVTHTHYR
eukprot:2803932-Prymnesium_polylepis.1